MLNPRLCRFGAVTVLSLALAACGGAGGGGGVASIPAPPSSPPPPPPAQAAVSIFSQPVAGTFASVGVSSTGQPVNHSGTLSSGQLDQVQIRYTASGDYEIQMPGAAWDKLIFAKGSVPADPSTFNSFQPQSAPQNAAYLNTSVTKAKGYQYSEMGAWAALDGRHGVAAFGQGTSAGQVPVTGSATYNGLVSGTSDVIGSNSFDGNFPTPVTGTVQLTFDFASANLAGGMTVDLQGSNGAIPLGSFAFTQTVYSAGSLTYSGKFDANAVGDNFFLGQFTGPNAQETIGAWALPFGLDGNSHQAFGAWVAKQ